jgi:hypothetical protein
MPITLEYQEISVGDTRTAYVDCQDELITGETVTGSPTVAEVTTSDLTLGTPAILAADVVYKGVTYPQDKGISFTVTGGTVNTTYTILATIATSESNTMIFHLPLRFV